MNPLFIVGAVALIAKMASGSSSAPSKRKPTGPGPGPGPGPGTVPPIPPAKVHETAKELAASLETDIRAHGMGYDHELLQSLQVLYGMKGEEIDGLYGVHSKAMLTALLGHAAPAILYETRGAPKSTSPTTAHFDAALATKRAVQVLADLNKNGRKYDHALMASFQDAAGMTGPGRSAYGPKTGGALDYWLTKAGVPSSQFYPGKNNLWQTAAKVAYTPPIV